MMDKVGKPSNSEHLDFAKIFLANKQQFMAQKGIGSKVQKSFFFGFSYINYGIKIETK
jgi:hypothetical protein